MHSLDGITSEVIQEVVSRLWIQTCSELIFATFPLIDRHHCWVSKALALHLAHALLIVLPEAVPQPPLVVMVISLVPRGLLCLALR